MHLANDRIHVLDLDRIPDRQTMTDDLEHARSHVIVHRHHLIDMDQVGVAAIARRSLRGTTRDLRHRRHITNTVAKGNNL